MTYIFIAILLGVYTIINVLAPLSGSATVTPIIASIVGAKDAIAVATVFFFLNCIPRAYFFRNYFRWDIAKNLWPVSITGALIGSILLKGLNETIVGIIILLFLSFFIYQKSRQIILKQKTEKKPTKLGVIVVGLISGALQGAGLAGADLRNGYLLSKGLNIKEIHGTTSVMGGTNFLFASLVRLYDGDLTFHAMLPVLALFPIIILATYIGRHLALKLNKPAQDTLSLVVMIIALVLLVRSLLHV
jgi:uncharacterized membrane protein YfcA